MSVRNTSWNAIPIDDHSNGNSGLQLLSAASSIRHDMVTETSNMTPPTTIHAPFSILFSSPTSRTTADSDHIVSAPNIENLSTGRRLPFQAIRLPTKEWES